MDGSVWKSLEMAVMAVNCCKLLEMAGMALHGWKFMEMAVISGTNKLIILVSFSSNNIYGFISESFLCLLILLMGQCNLI